MDSKGKAAITCAIIGVVASLVGVGSSTNWTFDFSTNIDQSTTIGDIISNEVNNYIVDNLGIDLEQFKKNCNAGVYEEQQAQGYCDIIR